MLFSNALLCAILDLLIKRHDSFGALVNCNIRKEFTPMKQSGFHRFCIAVIMKFIGFIMLIIMMRQALWRPFVVEVSSLWIFMHCALIALAIGIYALSDFVLVKKSVRIITNLLFLPLLAVYAMGDAGISFYQLAETEAIGMQRCFLVSRVVCAVSVVSLLLLFFRDGGKK
jgi:hypothetical protein